MNELGSREPSTNKAFDLIASLRHKQQEAQSKANQIAENELCSFEQNLRSSLRSAETTWEEGLAAIGEGLRSQKKVIHDQIAVETRRLLWMLKAPLLVVTAACVFMIVGSLAWWRIEDRERVHLRPAALPNGTFLVVDEPTWTNCVIAVQKSGNTTEIFNSKCKPIQEQ